MLAIAAKAAASTPNIKIQPGSAQSLFPAMGKFRVARIGSTFHWMARAETLASLDRIIEPAGAVLLFDDDEHENLPQNACRKAAYATIGKCAADDSTRAHPKSADNIPHTAIPLTSPCGKIETIGLFVRQPITRNILIHRALSLSSPSAARLGPRAETMLAEIRKTTAGWGRAPQNRHHRIARHHRHPPILNAAAPALRIPSRAPEQTPPPAAQHPTSQPATTPKTRFFVQPKQRRFFAPA